MLTEIEWWGGILFIGLMLNIIFQYIGEKDDEEHEFGLDSLLTYLFYILTAAVLALYFYPLEQIIIQQAYMGAIFLGLCFILVTGYKFWDDPDDEGEVDEDRNLEILAIVIISFPVIVTFGLGIYKSLDYVDNLPF